MIFCSKRPHARLAALALIISLPSMAPAETLLTFDEAMAAALRSQPSAQALRRDADASNQAALAARTLPDPEVAVGVQDFPVLGDMAFQPTSDEMTMYTIGVMREQVRRSRREAEAAMLRAEALVSSAGATAEERRIQRDVAIAWIDAVEAGAKQRLFDRLIDDLRTGRTVMEAGIATGSSAPALALQAQAEVSLAEGQQAEARSEEVSARARLARWIGAAANRPLPSTIPAFDLPAEADAKLGEHPELRLAEAEVQAARRRTDVAKSERRPDIKWSVMYGWRPRYDDMVSAQVSIPLQMNRAGRQDRRVEEASARADSAQLRVEARRRELHASYLAALADYKGAAARRDKIVRGAIPALEASFKAAEARYSAGQGSLELPLTIVRRYVEINVEAVEEQAKQARAAAEIVYLSGDLAR